MVVVSGRRGMRKSSLAYVLTLRKVLALPSLNATVAMVASSSKSLSSEEDSNCTRLRRERCLRGGWWGASAGGDSACGVCD